jgi:hypothetical protein
MENILESKKIEIASEGDLIMVKYPYNKLYDIRTNEDISEAKVNNEYSTEGEDGPVGVAEAGRHLAIFGSIHLAKEFNFTTAAYFLATHAILKRSESNIDDLDFLFLQVKTIYKEKRKAKIYGEIYSTRKELIFCVEIEYQIIQQAIFNKLFKRNLNTTISENEISPYIKRKALKNIIISNNNAKGDYGIVLAEECEGHFKNYPALPVAIIGNLLIDLGIKLFHNNTNNTFNNVKIIHTDIKALRLAFSGEEVYFSTNIKSIISENTINITGVAKVQDEIISTIEFKIKGDKC